jgi:hypothetical protein
MKRKITLSIALALSIVLLSLFKSDSAVNAEQPQRFRFDTGVITLGTNQVLRVTTVSGQGSGDPIPVEIISLNYMQTACNGGICKQAVSSQTVSAPVLLASNEAATFTCIPGSVTVRAVVLSNNRNLRVNAIVFDTSTQRVAATLEMEEVGFVFN